MSGRIHDPVSRVSYEFTPEGENLWFEQGPPKDFDFDDD